MDRIIAQLYDPAWWFTGFFFVGISALFTTSALGWLRGALGKVSGRVRERNVRRKAESTRRMKLLVNHPTLLEIAHTRVIFQFLLLLTTYATGLAFPLYHELIKKFPDGDPLGKLINMRYPIESVPLIISLLCLLGSFVIQIRFMDLVRECNLAREAIERHVQSALDRADDEERRKAAAVTAAPAPRSS